MTDHIIPLSTNQPIITTVKTHLEVTCDPAFDEAWINGVRYVPAPEGPAVTPDDARGLGSVADSVDAPEKEIDAIWDKHRNADIALREVYLLGFRHGTLRAAAPE